MSYRVFLSHAQDDLEIARWLSRRLNAYRTPGSLIGAVGAAGPVPARFEAIIGGAREGGVDHQAEQLSECNALIVLCSPASAGDVGVNRDVDGFVTMGRLRQILPVIAANAPEAGDVERDFFPPALCGRGLFTVDLREIRQGGALAGDGREGGLLKLIAALLGVDAHRIAQYQQRRQNLHVTTLALTTAIFAASTLAAGAFGLAAQRRNASVEAERMAAARNAMQAVQLRDAALAASEAEAARQAEAATELQRARGTLSDGVRDLSAMADHMLAEIAASESPSPANVQSLAALERVYWKLAEVSPNFQLRPASIVPVIEKIAATYEQIGRSDDSARILTRFGQLNRRIAGNRGASAEWRNAYASALLSLAERRRANEDAPGQISMLGQVGQILEALCLDAPSDAGASEEALADARVNACVRFASVMLTRAGAQKTADQSVDLARLERARLLLEAVIAAYPENARARAAAPRTRDQVVRFVERVQNEAAAGPGAAPGQD